MFISIFKSIGWESNWETAKADTHIHNPSKEETHDFKVASIGRPLHWNTYNYFLFNIEGPLKGSYIMVWWLWLVICGALWVRWMRTYQCVSHTHLKHGLMYGHTTISAKWIALWFSGRPLVQPFHSLARFHQFLSPCSQTLFHCLSHQTRGTDRLVCIHAMHWCMPCMPCIEYGLCATYIRRNQSCIVIWSACALVYAVSDC